MDPARSIFDAWVSERVGAFRARDFSSLLMARVLILARAGGGETSESRFQSPDAEYWNSGRSWEDAISSSTAEVRPGVARVVVVIGDSDVGEKGIDAEEVCLLKGRFSCGCETGGG
jgi:hypothetical protein